jgi:hypothetical protein
MNQGDQRRAPYRGSERPPCKAKVIRASELAQMGVCEQRVVFEHHYGPRRTHQDREAMLLGQRMHDLYHREALWILRRPPSFRFVRGMVRALVAWIVSIWKGRAGREVEHDKCDQRKDKC